VWYSKTHTRKLVRDRFAQAYEWQLVSFGSDAHSAAGTRPPRSTLQAAQQQRPRRILCSKPGFVVSGIRLLQTDSKALATARTGLCAELDYTLNIGHGSIFLVRLPRRY
jgi:hypothetical protein